MASRRMISTSLGSSRKFQRLHEISGDLGEFSQSLYPLLVVNADDHGRLEGDAFTIKHKVFPISPRSEDEFAEALRAMHEVQLIELYTVGTLTCLMIVNFETFQWGLKRRAKSRFPENSRHGLEIPENPRDGLGISVSRARVEQNRTEQNRTEELHVGSADVAAVFSYWQEVHSHPDAKLDGKRERAIKGALKLYSVDDLKVAVEGCKHSGYHQGDNDKHVVYDDIELICRDASHVDKFKAIALNGGSSNGSERPGLKKIEPYKPDDSMDLDKIYPNLRKGGE